MQGRLRPNTGLCADSNRSRSSPPSVRYQDLSLFRGIHLIASKGSVRFDGSLRPDQSSSNRLTLWEGLCRCLLTGSRLREDKPSAHIAQAAPVCCVGMFVRATGPGPRISMATSFSRRGGPAEPASTAHKVGDRQVTRPRGGAVVAVDIGRISDTLMVVKAARKTVVLI